VKSHGVSPAALLAGVDLAFEVDAVQLLLLALERRDVLGDQVLVLHGQHRELQPHHAPDLARPQAAGVHDMLGVHVALLGDDVPGAVAARLQIRDSGVPHDLGATKLRGFGIGLRHAIGIDVPLDRIEQRADEVLLVHQRKQSRRLIHRDDLELHAEVAAARLRHLQPVHALAGAGQHDAPGHVHTAGLFGDALDLLVEIDGVLLQLGDVRVAVDGVHAAGGVPGRAAGELAALDQQHVLPAGLGEMVEDARPHHAAADDHHPCLVLQVRSSLCAMGPHQPFDTASCSGGAPAVPRAPKRSISQERNSAIAVSPSPSGGVVR
jgi:hypothetical protein